MVNNGAPTTAGSHSGMPNTHAALLGNSIASVVNDVAALHKVTSTIADAVVTCGIYSSFCFNMIYNFIQR
jgi:hypothetical protein